ncbi:hypothetical protein [Saccharothrix longispora]|uniref:hypothetical protein n=1 Tax=Saccharothrix longispora TaxID=33920 RepID=UPI0028FD8E4A|nr:hypothetical protein [Saccharothrix longispora]MDU0290703.1 hypothetical protein [Saccharothrix longispora]
MTEPVPGQTPEPATTDAAAGTPPAAGTPSSDQPRDETPNADPTPDGTGQPSGQELFGGLSLADIEADIDRLMNDKMSELDGMLAGLEELVQRLEGEIAHLEPPADDTSTP